MTAATATETPTRHNLDEQPWWTPADNAEFHLLLLELVEAADKHKARKPACCGGDLGYCYPFAVVIGAVIDWRDHRAAWSLAVWLRRAETVRDTVAA